MKVITRYAAAMLTINLVLVADAMATITKFCGTL